MPCPGPWHATPRWLFWRATMRRQTWEYDTSGIWLPCYEYQHPAFVAREFLEETFADQTHA